MLRHVQRQHWYAQLPFSWAVEITLVVALVAGVAFAAIQLRNRDATITEQAVTLQTAQAQQVAMATSRNAVITLQDEYRTQLEQGLAMQERRLAAQDGTLNTYAEITTAWQQTGQWYVGQLLTLHKVAALDTELIALFGQRDRARTEMERALAEGDGVGWTQGLVQFNASQRQIDALLSQRTIELGGPGALPVSAPIPTTPTTPLYLPWPGIEAVPAPVPTTPVYLPWPGA